MPHDATEHEISQLRLIDQISDRFEERLRAGDQPTIEEFLATAPEGIRRRLLLELLPLELDWRSRNRLPVTADEYQQRFSHDAEIIKSVLADWFRAAPAQVVLDDTKLMTPGDKLAIDSTFDVSRAGASSAPAPVTSAAPDRDLSIPSQIGRYEVIRLLGSGAMGAVYLAKDPELGRQVAVKVPKLEGTHGNTSAQIERFQREARAAATLHHPHLCSVFDVGEADGVRYITMAYIEGRSLSEVSRRGRQQPERQVATLGRKLALALQVAHDAGVVHRDLKPGNIMIDKSGTPVIMDFGLALLVESNDDARITHSGTIVGSPAYMSPEQVSGNPAAVGPSSDIYSLGVVLFELLTGQLPFQGGVMAVLRQIESSDPPPIESLRPDADAELVSIISTMMARKTEDRYPSMKSVASDLTRWLRSRGGQPDTSEFKSASFQSTVRPGSPAIEETVLAQRRRTGRQSAFGPVRTRIALSMLALLAFAAVIVFQFGTASVRIKVNDNRVAVQMDNEQLTLTDLNWRGRTWNGKHNLGLLINGVKVPIGKELPFKIENKSHRLIATLGGTELSSDEFEIHRGADTALKITLVELETDPKPETPGKSKDERKSIDFRRLVEATPIYEDNFNDDLVLVNVNQNLREIRSGHLIYDYVTPVNVGATTPGLQAPLTAGLVEVDVRSTEISGHWMITLGNADIQSSMTLSVEHGALISKVSVPKGSERESSRQIISTDLPLQGGQKFDRVQLLVREKSVEVAINGESVGSVIEVPFNLHPGQISCGFASTGGHAHVEYDRMACYRFLGTAPGQSEQPSVPPEMIVQAGQEIDLLKVTPLDQMLYYGAWQQAGKELKAVIAAPPNRNLLELPVRPQGEYDLEIDVTCPQVPNLTIRLPMASTGVGADFTVAAYNGQAMAIGVRNMTAMALPEPMGRRPSAIKASRRHAIVAKVRREDDQWSISGWVDGEEVVRWEGELVQLSSLHRAWQSADLLRPVIGQWFDPNAEMTVHAARLRVVSGEAHLMPEPSLIIPPAARAKPKTTH